MGKDKDNNDIENIQFIMLEHLKALRSDMEIIKSNIAELRASDNSLRNHFHILQGDFLRQEQALAAVRVDIDRIKNRLDLVEA